MKKGKNTTVLVDRDKDILHNLLHRYGVKNLINEIDNNTIEFVRPETWDEYCAMDDYIKDELSKGRPRACIFCELIECNRDCEHLNEFTKYLEREYM